MRNFNIFIVDDNLDDIHQLSTKLKQFAQEHDFNFSIDYKCSFQESEINNLDQYEILFFDINLNDCINSLSVINKIKITYPSKLIILFTHHIDYAYQAFNVLQDGFILKNEEYTYFKNKLYRFMYDKYFSKGYLSLKKHSILINDIVMIVKFNKKLEITLRNNQMIIDIGTLRQCTEQLPKYFYHFDKSTIVNLNTISYRDHEAIYLITNYKLYIPNITKAEFNRIYHNFLLS